MAAHDIIMAASGGSTAATYIEDVFSTYLYTGTGSSGLQIQNGIDLAGKGGLVIGKARSGANAGTVDWGWIDTARGGSSVLYSNTTDAAWGTSQISSFNADGFTLNGAWPLNYYGSPYTYGSWTFRKQPKFFDVVTYTGTGSAQNIAHNLGSVPGCIIVKAYSGGTASSQNWPVYHRSIANTETLLLNTTDAKVSVPGYWNSTTPTATQFTVGTANAVNQSGTLYVAYLFAHNAGGFGLTGTDNVISCGSFSCSPSGTATVTLGYEPQWILAKDAANAGSWELLDVMRGMSYTATEELVANTSGASYTYNPGVVIPTATGFTVTSSSPFGTSSNIIYIAIRRGPMKTPTSGTSVFSPAIYTGDDVNGRLISSGFPVDSAIIDPRNGYATPGGPNWFSRLTGNGYFLQTAQTNAESNGNSNSNGIMGQDGITVARTGTNVWSNVASNTYVSWFLRRAPGFFDVVCYTSTGSFSVQNHNLTVQPEIVFYKTRSTANDWYVLCQTSGTNYSGLFLNNTSAATPVGAVASMTPTTFAAWHGGGTPTIVAYLFASCPGVSKVGTYTGNGSTQTINCGFTGGARFVLIKRTDSTGDWYVYDTARGMTTLTDPYLLLNSTAAESATLGSVTTVTTGFAVNASILAAINTNGASYIFLAIA